MKKFSLIESIVGLIFGAVILAVSIITGAGWEVITLGAVLTAASIFCLVMSIIESKKISDGQAKVSAAYVAVIEDKKREITELTEKCTKLEEENKVLSDERAAVKEKYAEIVAKLKAVKDKAKAAKTTESETKTTTKKTTKK